MNLMRAWMCVAAPLFLLGACAMEFDTSKIAAAAGGPDSGKGGTAGKVSTSNGGVGIAAQVLWVFSGNGMTNVVRDIGSAGFHADIFPVPPSSDVGQGVLENGAWATKGGVMRTDPQPAGTGVTAALYRSGALSLELWIQGIPNYSGKPHTLDVDMAQLMETEIAPEFHVSTTAEYKGNVVKLLSTAQMRHLIGTFNNSGGIARLYVDGDEAAYLDMSTKAVPAPKLVQPDREVRLQVGDPGFEGRIWLAAVYDRSLSPADVRALYLAGPTRGR